MYIAVDFDGTCVEHRYPYVGIDCDGGERVLKRIVESGNKLILLTMRGTTASPQTSGKTVLDDAIQKELNITTEKGKENVNLFSNIEGINAWCSITEDPKDNCWRISIRSKGTPINGVAAKWEGGGHAQASGAKINNLEQLPAFIKDLDELFK